MKLLTFALLLISFSSFSQTRDEIIEEFRQERSKMMKEIMKMFKDDDFMQDDFFGSDMHPFDNIERLKKIGGENIAIEERSEKDGSISIIITPKSKDISIDISTENNLITIKTETRVEETTKDKDNSLTSMSSSRSQRSIAIPNGFKALGPQKEGKGIKISLVPVKSKVKKIYKDKFPIKKRAGEVTI